MNQAGIYHIGIAKGHHHKGPRTAGNKSLISYRAGHGIVGYNGYIPSWESIPIPVKDGPSTRAGPESSKDRAQPAWVIEKSVQPLTTYERTISRATTASRPATAPAMVGHARYASEEHGAYDSTVGHARYASEAEDIKQGQIANESSMDRTKMLPVPPFLGTTIYRTSYHVPKDDLEPIQARPRKKPAFLYVPIPATQRSVFCNFAMQDCVDDRAVISTYISDKAPRTLQRTRTLSR
jgi:hypothetical protein